MTLSVNPITSVLCVVDLSEEIGASFFTVTKKFIRNISVESEVVARKDNNFYHLDTAGYAEDCTTNMLAGMAKGTA